MTTNATPTVDDLRARLAGYRQKIAEAGHQLAAAELEGTSTAAASKRLAAARDGARSARLALNEAQRRGEEDKQRERAAQAVGQQGACYRWFVEHLRLAEEVLRLRALVVDAKADVEAHSPPRKVYRAQYGFDGLVAGERDLDQELLSATRGDVFERLSVGTCQGLRERAELLAAEEERRLADLRGGDLGRAA